MKDEISFSFPLFFLEQPNIFFSITSLIILVDGGEFVKLLRDGLIEAFFIVFGKRSLTVQLFELIPH